MGYGRPVNSAGTLTTTEEAVLDGATAGTGVASKAVVLDSSGNHMMPASSMWGLSRGTLAAAGSSATDAAVIVNQVTVVTGADNAKGVALPAAATTVGPYWVINDTTAKLLVYPVNGGNDNINALAEDAAFTMEAGTMALFIPTSATLWYAATVFAQGLPFYTSKETVANAGTVSAANLRGRVLFQDASGGNVTMTTRTGTQTAGDFPELRTGDSLLVFHYANHASNTSTLSGGTDVTLIGSGAVTTTGGTYLLRKTAATTFDMIRVS
jgi:hypothetical protein